MKLTLEPIVQHLDDIPGFSRMHRRAGAPFLQDGIDLLLGQATLRFPDLQLLVRSGGDLVGGALLLPLHWNGTGGNLPLCLEELLIRAVGCRELGKRANTLACLSVATAGTQACNGLRAEIVEALKRWAPRQGFRSMVVAVRPALKPEYPLVPIEQYAHWRRSDGKHFDPELRLHADLGGSVLSLMPQAVTVAADLSAWERWTGTAFAESGEYIVDGSQKPVLIDRDGDCGFYEEARIWVTHPLQKPHRKTWRSHPLPAAIEAFGDRAAAVAEAMRAPLAQPASLGGG